MFALSGTLPSARERTGFMQTQVDIIQSSSVARRVVDNLKLAEDPRAREAFARAKAPGSIEDWIATNLLLRLKVDSSQSSVIQIQYAANDAKAAANIANASAPYGPRATTRASPRRSRTCRRPSR